MSLTFVALGCLIVAQAELPVPDSLNGGYGASSDLNGQNSGVPAAEGIGPAAAPIPEQSTPPVEPVFAQTPKQMVIAALILPRDGGLTGRPVTLLEALSATTDRRTQLKVIHAYWRLTTEVASYRAAWDEIQQLEKIQGNVNNEPLLRVSRASSLAALETAKLAANVAQYQLAETANLRLDSMLLPLPADPPHVGSYDTYYKQLAATRPLPSRLRLLDRMLPLDRQAIHVRSSALQASADAFSALDNAYQSGGANLIDVIDSLLEITKSQRALVETACQYNHDIVDYTLSVISPSIQGESLVGALIDSKPARPTSNSDARRTFEQTGEDAAVGLAAFDKPTLAPRKGSVQDESRDSMNRSASGMGSSEKKWNARHPSDETPLKVTVQRPTTSGALYSAFANLTPSDQAKRLTTSLYTQRAFPEPTCVPTPLEDCLSGLSRAQCKKVLDVYWQAAYRVAMYQVLVDKRDLLDNLLQINSTRPGGLAEDTKRLRSAQESVEAELLEAHRNLLETAHDLTIRTGRSASESWLIPQTPPHVGGYQLMLDALPRELAKSWPIRRLAASVPTLADHLVDRAAIVIEADAVRFAATTDFQNGTRSLDEVIALLDRQVSETNLYLASVTDYNRAIAEYLARVLPGNLPSKRLIKTLVLAP